jgi:hypothetical protein
MHTLHFDTLVHLLPMHTAPCNMCCLAAACVECAMENRQVQQAYSLCSLIPLLYSTNNMKPLAAHPLKHSQVCHPTQLLLHSLEANSPPPAAAHSSRRYAAGCSRVPPLGGHSHKQHMPSAEKQMIWIAAPSVTSNSGHCCCST